MPRFSISLDLLGKPVVIVGGGKIAARKCIPLLRSGARVTVIAPTLVPVLKRLAAAGSILHISREFLPDDLTGFMLAFAATDSSETNRAVALDAEHSGILVNAVDAPRMSSFESPALLCRGDLTIAVATSGKSPALSRRIRRELAAQFGREYADTVRLLGKVREKLLTQSDDRRYNKQILSELATCPLPGLFRSGSFSAIDELMLASVGPGFTLAELGLRKEVSP
jgi:precorrin-2 dehydrogenase/sirohydrochlorin ferrochelatase